MAHALREGATLGLAMRFDVVIDGFDLGSWSACKGLALRFRHEKVKELGEHSFISHIPGRAEYTKVTLQRAMTSGDWDKTKRWLADVVEGDWTEDLTHGASRSATITLRDSYGDKVAEWTLDNAIPIGWKGPQLDAMGKKIALESLELMHEGFLS